MEYKLMVVDDDDFIRLSVRELMRSTGIGVVEADGALSCLQELKNGFRGVVLMDIMMPGLDGWDAIRMILDEELYKDIIIVMFTAVDEPNEKMEGLQAYVTDYITKPFDPGELIEIVKDNIRFLEQL